jgi:hypothetical protein
MFIAKGLCGRLFFLVGQQTRRISWYIWYALCLYNSLFHSLSRDKDMYIIQCSLQGGMKIQEKHLCNFQ